MIRKLDHVNIRTNNLPEMEAFYQRVLKLRKGPRPEFSFGGAWLYCGDDAIVHLVGTTNALQGAGVQVEHFALKAEGFEATIEHLKNVGVDYEVSAVPGYDMTQIFVRDVDGNRIELNFDRRPA